MKKQLPPPPVVYVPVSIAASMAEESMQHPTTETGATFLGVETDQGEIVILAVIPDLTDTVRNPGLFSQGGEDQVEVYKWYAKHWDDMLARSTGMDFPWALNTRNPVGYVPLELRKPLVFLGDWHKHPGQYKTLSGTDLRQIRSILSSKDEERPQLLAPIVTVNSADQITFEYSGDGSNELLAMLGTQIQMNWYYARRGEDTIYRVAPTIVNDEYLPQLPPLPWYLADLSLMQKELAKLRNAEYTVRWAVRQMDDDFELEIVFAVDHPNWTHRMLLVTQWDYPHTKPTVQLYPKTAQEEKEAEEPVTKSNRDLLSWLKALLFNSHNTKQQSIYASTWQGYTSGKTYLLDLVRKTEPEILVQKERPDEKATQEKEDVNDTKPPVVREPVGQSGEDDRDDSD